MRIRRAVMRLETASSEWDEESGCMLSHTVSESSVEDAMPRVCSPHDDQQSNARVLGFIGWPNEALGLPTPAFSG